MKKTQNKFYDLLKTDEAVFDFFQRYALDGLIFQDLSTPQNSWVNDKLYHVLGYIDEEQNVLDDILSSPQIKNNVPLIRNQNNLTTEVCFKHKNGKDIWMVATSLYYSENDTIVTALKDITRTKEHELILENCNQEAQIGFWEIDILETNKLYWSSVTKDIHEVEHHYIPDIESAIFFYKEGYNRNIIAELHSLAINKGISYTQELEIVTAKGNEKWIRTTCIPKLVNGKCISLYGTFQDITIQKKLNQQLEEEKVKLKNVIEGARIGTWEWNVQSGETIYNNRWAEMLGYTLAEISPMNISTWENLVHPEDLKKSETLLENCFNRKSDYYEGEFRMKHKNGSWIWVYDKGKVFSWTEDGKPLMMYGIHLDITEKINEIDRYIGFIKHAPSAIAMFDIDMRYMAVSEQWVKDYGLKGVSEVIGKTHYDLFPEIGDDWKAIHQKCLTGEKASRDEDKFIRINGDIQWLKWAINPWYTPNGQVGGLIMMTEDITQAINNKELLHISEETFRGNFEYASIGMAISDNTGKGIKVNKKLCDMLGYSKLELLNISFVEITHPDDLEKDLALLKKVSDGEIDSYQIEKRCIHKQGHIVYIILALSVVKDDNNNILYYITQMVDITQLKETEQKLADALLHNQTILDASTQISIIRTDEHGIITTFNIGAENLLGYSAEEVLNKHTPLLFHSKEELEKQSKKIQSETGKIVSGFDVFVHMIENSNTPVSEWTYINKNNEQIPVLLTLNSVKQNGKNVGYLGIGINITEIKKAEKDIENLLNVTQDQNLRLRNFAHIVSHNLRSHSGNIGALIDILQIEQKVLEDNVVFSYLKAASNNLKETIDHLNTVAALNASGTQKSDKINIKPLIESAISNVTGLAYDAKVTIQNLVNEDIFISGDLAYLDSIFLNLLTNGIKYRSTERNSYVIVSAKQTDQYIAISFKDNGLGIDLQKNGSKIFGMYKTFHKNPDARGVGLFITKNQIEAMGGKIEVESSVNVGSTFTVYFKLAQ